MFRGDTYYAYLTGVGNEQQGLRPVVILQNNLGNKHSNTTIVAPITTRTQTTLPTQVPVNEGCGLFRNSTVLLEQIRTVDVSRIDTRIGKLDRETMERVEKALRISLGLDEG